MSRCLTLLCAAALLAAPAFAQTPKLKLNGVTAADNNAIPHLAKLGPMAIELSGTPGAPFALLLSGDAFDGLPVGETDLNTGFFLRRWLGTNLSSPIHPVFDGIGTTFIATKLGQPAGDFVSDNPSPLFRFNATGKFTVTGLVPPQAALLNQAAGGANPFVVPLESGGTETALYLQILELDVATLNLRIGNGMRVVFDPIAFGGTVLYSEGQDANPNSVVVANTQTLATIIDSDFASGSPLAPTPTSTAEFDATFQGKTDLWMITLAGIHDLVGASTVPNGPGGVGNPPDPDNSYATNRDLASGIEFLTGARPARDNENYEFPVIQIPGNRAVFHWRNGSSLTTPTYGFGVLYRDTGVFRNLTPAGFAFSESPTRSPWEVEVGITPDGNRMLAVLDQSTATDDRLFLFNLEAGGTFGNGLPVIEVQKPVAPDQNFFRRIWEESFSFLTNGSGVWTAYFCTTNDTFSVAQYPKRLFQVELAAPGATGPLPAKVLPQPAPLNVTQLDRQPVASPHNDVLVISASYDGSMTNEQLFAVTSPTPTSSTIKNITNYTATSVIQEWNDTYDGTTGWFAFSDDGSRFAFARTSGATQLPQVVLTTPPAGAPPAVDLIGEISGGGLFAIAEDYTQSREYRLTEDNNHLLFFQGSTFPFPPSKTMDLYRIRLSDRETLNLTRTILGSQETESAYLGPWNPPLSTDRPTVDPAGSWLSPNGDFLYFFRDHRPSFPFITKFNVIAVSIGAVGSQPPTFEVTNVTGTEFAPKFGLAKPTTGAPDVMGLGGLVSAPVASFHQTRRVGGEGPFANFYYMVSQLSNPTNPLAKGMDQLWMFDGNLPAPAIQLTNFAVGSSPVPSLVGGRILNPIPSKTEFKVAFIFDQDGLAAATILQDLFYIDLASFGALTRVPTTATPFTRLITRGTIHFLPTGPDALLYASGSIPRGSGVIDGVSVSTDPINPIDASPFFFRFDTPTVVTKIAPDAAGSNRRAAYIYGVTPQ